MIYFLFYYFFSKKVNSKTVFVSSTDSDIIKTVLKD